MTHQSKRLITLKSGLSERELHILNIEFGRRGKSKGVTYYLWLFLSGLGMNKFYLGRITTGLAIILLVFGGSIMVHSDAEAGTGTAMVGLLALVAYGVWMSVDLFTIPRTGNYV